MDDTIIACGEQCAPPSLLVENHLADLRTSGLSDEQIRRSGFRTISDPCEVARLLRWQDARSLGPCLVIPYFRPDGSMTPITEHVQLKPDHPRLNKDGKPIKYESPRGSSVRLHFPPGTTSKLNDPAVPLLFTEGAKKAAKADQEGFACVALGGVDAWSKKRETGADGEKVGNRELCDDFKAISLQSRRVYIVFDSDIAEKTSVQWAAWNLSQALTERGADVGIVRLPNGPPAADGESAKVGIDDYLVAHSVEEFQELLDAAQPVEKPWRQIEGPNEASDDPHRLARQFLEQRHTTTDGVFSLRLWRDEWWRWDGRSYHPIPASELRADLANFIKSEFDSENIAAVRRCRLKDKSPPLVQQVKSGLLHNVTIALSSFCILSSNTLQPSWLVPDAPFPAAEVVATRSGLLHIPSLVAGNPSALPPTPQFFSAGVVDYEFDGAAECPSWQAFLHSIWPDDLQSIESLQEWFGYLLLPDTRQHKLLLLIGPVWSK